jgi:hypothetical protein
MSNFDQRKQNVGIQLNAENIYLSPPSAQNVNEVIKNAERLLVKQSFEEADKILQSISETIPQAGYANILRAIAILAGRTVNEIHPNERKKFETRLSSARNNEESHLLALVLLAALENDYYNYHGQISENNISVESVQETLKNNSLSVVDLSILKLTKISEEVKVALGIS